jgi:hypothetical protein
MPQKNSMMAVVVAASTLRTSPAEICPRRSDSWQPSSVIPDLIHGTMEIVYEFREFR